jgi:ATP-dependent helicase/nuclease subunit A
MDDCLLDEASRKKIINELDRNFFVEAGAGSGKTHCLVERMVNIIKNGKAKIENISAVTFTRKAAAELKERFQIRLEESLKQECGLPQKDNIAEALSNLEQVFIGTIHSFCSKILRERPVEAGVDPGFNEIEEEEDAIYADNAWSLYIEYCHLDKANGRLNFFEEHGILPEDLKDSYKKIIRFPDVKIVTGEVLKPDFLFTKKQVSQFISSLLEVMPEAAHENGRDELQKLIKKAAYFIDNGYLSNDVLFVKMLKDLGKSTKVTQNRWPNGNGLLYQEQMEEFRKGTVRPAIRKWQEYLHKPCADFIERGAGFYSNWRKDHSILNFTDLLILTSKLLRTNEELRLYFKNKYTHILVDEFQDTDPIQAELFLFLTGTDVNETDWRKIIPEPGSLFLVGDPKQSIYRFRRADISIYDAVKKIFAGGNSDGKSNNCGTNDGKSNNCGNNDKKNENPASEVLALFSNFRSLPFMKGLVEKVFKPVFPEEEETPAYQAKYFPLNTVRTASPDYDYGVFENNIEKVPKNNAAQAAAVDAERIAGWIDFSVNKSGIRLERTTDEIKSGLTEKAVYSDFLILSRKREHLGLYVKALENKGIPYDISGGKIFNKSVELSEILKLFKAVEDDRDPVALVTALRGLFFGISDTRLYEFSIAGGKFSIYSAVPEGFDDFKEAYERLGGYKKTVKDKEPLVAAEIILEDLGIIPLAVTQEEGLTRAGNIYKALELLRDYREEEIGLFYDLVRNLEELLKTRDVESLSLLASRKDVVRIMNLHKAKGLEAPVVILADPLGEAGDFAPESHISRAESDTRLIIDAGGRAKKSISRPAGDAGHKSDIAPEGKTDKKSDIGPESDTRYESYPGIKSDAESKGYFCIIKSNGNYGNEIIGIPPDWDDKAAEETKYDMAERKRLEYVAVTRAKNILVVSTYSEGSKAKAWEIIYEYLKEENVRQIPVSQSSLVKEMESVRVSREQWEQEKEEISGIAGRLTAPGYKTVRVTAEAKESYLFGFGQDDYQYFSAGNDYGRSDETGAVHKQESVEKDFIQESKIEFRNSNGKYSELGQSTNEGNKSGDSVKGAREKSGSPGVQYGILAHKVVEIIGRGNYQKVRILASQWAADEGLGNKAAGDLAALAEKFSSGDLLKRINSADKKYFEVPFALTQDDSIIHGVIDLVFQEGNKWVIVDYKTGDFEADYERKSIYLKQLELYKKYWEKISGQEVAETILYKI